MLRILVLMTCLLCLGSTSAQLDWFESYEPSISYLTEQVTILPTSWRDEQHCGDGCYNEFYLTFDLTFAIVPTSPVTRADIITVQIPATGDISFFLPEPYSIFMPSFGFEPTSELETTSVLNSASMLEPTTTLELTSILEATVVPQTTSILPGIKTEYGSWREVWSEGVCTDMSSNVTLEVSVTLPEIDVFGPDKFGGLINTASLSSMLISQLGRPVCTKSTHVQTVSITSFPKTVAPKQTSVSNAEAPSTDTQQLSRTAKISIGITIGIGSGLIFSFLAFFIWKRHLWNQALQGNLERSKTMIAEDKTRAQAKLQVKERQNMAYWMAPLTMLGGILAGAALAIGHHYMYASIAGQPVDDQISQSWIFRFGTLLAFLVKISFGTSIGVAFSQFQWLEIRQKSLSIGEIDIVSNILNDLLNFLHRTWLLLPTLTFLATTWWLLSLVPVITPGSLNVISSPHQLNLPLTVPRFNMNHDSHTWYDLEGYGGNETAVEFFNNLSPTPALNKIIFSTALGGQILFPVAPQNANQSFHLDFFAPAVDCHPANVSIATLAAMLHMYESNFFTYFSWAGNDFWMLKEAKYPSKLDDISGDAARLYIAFAGIEDSPPVVINGKPHHPQNVTECLLYNASYDVDFTSRNSELSLRVSNISFENYVAPTNVPWTVAPYLSLMSGLGDLLVGASSPPKYTMINLLSSITNETVESAVEELFQNMTLSVLTSGNSSFTYNDTVMGQVITYRITYVYRSFELLTVYTLAFIITLLCSAIGFYAFLVNGGSYRNVFSTFLRATNSCEFPIADDDLGIEPRPNSLGHVKVDITPKFSGSNAPSSIEEENLIETVPVPPAFTHLSPQNQQP